MRGRSITTTPSKKSAETTPNQQPKATPRKLSAQNPATVQDKEIVPIDLTAEDVSVPASEPVGISLFGRYVPDKSDHGKLYFNLSYQLTESLRVGLDYRPLTDDVTPLINWRVFPENDTWRPALILGTSNDDFGKVNSDAYFGTLSKHLFSYQDIHLSGYAGATYIEELDIFRTVGGGVISYHDWSTTLMYSGTDYHWVLSRQVGNQTFSVLFYALDLPGVAYGISF